MSELDRTLEVHRLRDQVVGHIRAGIVYGEIAPGTVHSAPALAARLGVSITPVREALLELTGRGMVSQVRNRGFQVVEHTPQDLDAALELRELLEVPMLVRLSGQFSPDQATHFRRVVDDGVRAARAGDFSAFLDLDRRFHLGLLELAGNPRIVAIIDQVLDHLRLATFRRPNAADALLPVAEGHRDILEAVCSRDLVAIERTVAAHLTLTRSAWTGDRAEDQAAA